MRRWKPREYVKVADHPLQVFGASSSALSALRARALWQMTLYEFYLIYAVMSPTRTNAANVEDLTRTASSRLL